MGKDPALLWYPNDWIGGTMGMTFEQKGAYFELLMAQFNRGHMTEDMIGQMVGQNWVTIKDKFIQDENGLWYNKRLEFEQQKRQRFVQSRYNNKSGKNQYSKNRSYDQSYVNEVTEHMENENENENKDINECKLSVSDLFSKTYNAYPKKQGKAKGEQAYHNYLNGGKLIGKTRYRYNHQQIYIAVQQYAEEKKDSDPQYIAMFSTFMNSHIVDYVEKTQHEYREVMLEKYGDEWEKVKFSYV